ncbi:MAG: hypothetical protein EOM15_05495 [Spirochaetia bacterium]|nr:hypothetical protein [Spirochaetia bacterium]
MDRKDNQEKPEEYYEKMNAEITIKMQSCVYTSLEELAEKWGCTKEILALRLIVFGYDHLICGQEWGADYANWPDILHDNQATHTPYREYKDNILQFPCKLEGGN